MIDPLNITNFKNTKEQLEENLFFWVLAAGKNAITASRCLENLMISIHKQQEVNLYRPFYCIEKYDQKKLAYLFKIHGIGCYNNKSKTFYDLANSNLDLFNCSCEDLENIYGIGMKTSRCFIIHTRKNAKCAGLDVHILNFLRDKGYNVPKQTPTRKNYLEIEKIFLELVESSQMSVAQYDLMIWKQYSQKNMVKI